MWIKKWIIWVKSKFWLFWSAIACYNEVMNWRKWLDGFTLAGKGILLATRKKRFWVGFLLAFLGFGWLINMLSNGFAEFQLLGQLTFPKNLTVIGSNFLAIFGIGVNSLSEWLPGFLMAFLQGLLIGLIVLLWQKQEKGEAAKTKGDDVSATNNGANLEKAGIITGLIALGAGCPTCGTTLIAPLVGVIFSAGGAVGANTISTVVSVVVTWIAVIIAVLSLKRLGEEYYVIIRNEKYLARKQVEAANLTKKERCERSR